MITKANRKMKVVLIFSGGADSTTVLYWLLDQGHDVSCLSFDYGQRHHKEIMCARNICELLDVEWRCIDLSGFAHLCNSSLLGDSDIPHGHYEDDNMKQTVVPNRNMVMLSIAGAMAISNNFDAIAIGAHEGDHTIYPDCRYGFLHQFETALWAGNWCKTKPCILAPFLDRDKTEIIKIGLGLGVPYNMTWTCYEGKKEPCGKCGSCVERDEAFRLAS